MSNVCGTLTAGQDADCDYKPVGGVEGEIMLLNWDEVRDAVSGGTITFDSTTDNIIDAFAFAASSTKQGYIFQGFQDTTRPSIVNAKRAAGNYWIQTVNFVVVGNIGATDKKIELLGNGLYVAIIKNKWHNELGAGKYKIYGMEAGLMMDDGNSSQDPYGDDNGVWRINLASPETGESTPVYTLFNTSETTTDAIYTALQSPA
jgi:hypothetical protein